jgi:hypothetical protein
MKKIILALVINTIYLSSLSLFSQTNEEPVALGLPGDNLNLYAVLDVFQKSKTLEEFEKIINDKETKINNLDLNNDKFVDYIQVTSHKEGDSYSIVLRTAITDKENQDIAVIEVNKNKGDKVLLQIIGDEELYGKNYIVEPTGKNVSETPNPGYTGHEKIIINEYDNGVCYVNDWPIIVHLYSPVFTVYVSPWYWGFYPSYWYAWSPIYYYDYWGIHHHYYRNHLYRRVSYVRYPVRYSNYSSRRNSSSTVIQNRRGGNYDATYGGRTYKRPDAPVVIPPRTSRTRTETPREATPRTRKVVPETRRAAPPSPRTIEPSRRETREVNPPSRRK